MTISPLMVELLPTDSIDLQVQQNWLRGHFKERTSVAPFPWSWVCVESIISQRGETWKSKALLIYHFKYILFVSSWNFHCFLNFIGCCLQFAYSMMQLLQKGRLMKLCDGDCTIKKEIGNNVSLSSIFIRHAVRAYIVCNSVMPNQIRLYFLPLSS